MRMTSSSPSSCLSITTAFLLSAMVTMTMGISMRETFFQTEILPNCYKLDMQRKLYILGQASPQGPLGQSMENFISLIEKIEDFEGGRRLSGTRPDIIARMLLSRFHIDEYNYLDHSGVYYQENVVSTRNRITEILLEAASSPTEPLLEDDWKTVLTPDEKCSMYFMLSHNVNRTALPSDRRTYMAAPVNPNVWASSSNNGQRPNPNWNINLRTAASTLMTEQAREYGVVGFRNDEAHAIAPARVLLGIIAANGGRQQASASEVMKQVGLDIPPLFRESMLEVPLIVTLGEVWGYGASPSTSEDRDRINFGASGTWNSTLCQVEYKLNTNYTKGSLAEVRGAIDGYLLGIKSRDVIAKGSFKLSSLLRQYYSPTGLFDEFTSVCNRRRIDQEIGPLKDQTRNYLSLLLKASRIPMGEDRITSLVDKSQKEFEMALRDASSPIQRDVDWCSRTKNTDPNGGVCETPSDLVVVVDTEAPGEGLLTQMDITKRLSNDLDMRRYGSSMTIVAATRNGGYMDVSQGFQSTDSLSRIAWNTTNRGCATCRFAFADFANFGSGFRNQPDQLLKYLNATLRDLKRGKEGMRWAPGRPVLFFNYGAIRKSTGDQRSLEAAKWDLNANHRDVPILMAGEAGLTNQDDLKAYVHDEKRDVFLIDPDVRGVTEMLGKRICEVPAVIQHPSCRIETSSGMTSNHFITRGRKQYFAMYPEYFLKSYNIMFEIKAVNGPIKACYRRGYEKPEEDERNCEKLDPKGVNTRIMRSANPCYKFSLSDCPPFYFTIVAPDEGSTASTKCLKEQCLNMDQVEWTFSHTGVSCNSVHKLMSSFTFLSLAALVSYSISNLF